MLSRVTDPVVASKAELRRRMRLVRDIVEDRVLRSVSLWAAVAATEAYEGASTVMAFVAVDGEPDTDSLFARLTRDGKTLVLPALVDDVIVPKLVGAGLVAGPFGVPTPQGEAVPFRALDLVIVPGLAFTGAGDRLGRGGGHYDRFLASLPEACPTIGVCFTEQLVDDLPLESHDRPVGEVVTDPPTEPSSDL